MSSAALPDRRTALYGIAGLVLLVELAIGWAALHPEVADDYRAYYIERSTTCLNQPVSGAYAFGTELATRSGSQKLVAPLKVCGWEGPVGDGLHALGEQSRLRLAVADGARDLTLMLEMVAVDMAGPAGQAVEVLANGSTVGVVRVAAGTPQRFSFKVPDSLLRPTHRLEVELVFPEAIRIGAQDSNTRKRSIKLSAVRLG